MGASEMANDAMAFVAELAPFWLIFGAVAFADITVGFLIRNWKQIRTKGSFKW